MSDPQIPKSIWWLADAGWIGFRVVCEGPIDRAAPNTALTNPTAITTTQPTATPKENP
jgi:hypothetical protein